MDTCVCMAESLRCSPETITTLSVGYTPIQSVFGGFFFKNNPIQNTILHLVVMSLLGCDLVFDDFDSFAESWSALL